VQIRVLKLFDDSHPGPQTTTVQIRVLKLFEDSHPGSQTTKVHIRVLLFDDSHPGPKRTRRSLGAEVAIQHGERVTSGWLDPSSLHCATLPCAGGLASPCAGGPACAQLAASASSLLPYGL